MNRADTEPTVADRLADYRSSATTQPLFLHGDARELLQHFPDESVDFVMTSPPYWGQREYAEEGIGLERTLADYIANLLAIFSEVHRVLKSTGSFWLNLGDAYQDKGLALIPYRVALAMVDDQGWHLRNTVVWNKVKGGPDNSTDKLRNVHEPLFHFVKQPRGYFYDVDAIRKRPGTSKVVNGKVVSATGVSGVKYKRQIELSTELSEDEKSRALEALTDMLNAVKEGRLSDFRMIIRGQQRTTHSNSTRVSGRARELQEKGFYFLKYHPKGTKPSDVWDIIPEDTWGRSGHPAPYPEDLCRIPLLATCPTDGLALDPFCGTGTTNFVAMELGRKSVGIDLSAEYISQARNRCSRLI